MTKQELFSEMLAWTLRNELILHWPSNMFFSVYYALIVNKVCEIFIISIYHEHF